MKVLIAAIIIYLMGLLTFYTLASFGTRAWDFTYFGWARTGDGGILFIGALYYTLKKPYRDWIKWIYAFSYLRLALEIQNFFTGVNVNNTTSVAVGFICVLLIVIYLTWFNDREQSKWLSKKLGL